MTISKIVSTFALLLNKTRYLIKKGKPIKNKTMRTFANIFDFAFEFAAEADKSLNGQIMSQS